MKLILRTSLFFFLAMISGYAQEVKFTHAFHHLTAEDGLPRAEIYDVIQDSKGSMWFSTDAGVVRYDGYYFKTYGTEDGLLSTVVFESYEDPFGRIWFISLSNELSYYENDKIVPYKFNHLIKERTGEITSSVKYLYINEQGDLFYSMSKSGFIKIDKTGHVTSLHETPLTFQITRIDNRDIPSSFDATYYKGNSLIARDTFSVFHSDGKKKRLLGKFGSGKRYAYVNQNGTLELTIISSMLIDLKTDRIIAENVIQCVTDIHEENVVWLLGENGAQKCTYIDGKFIYGESYLSGNYITNLCWDSEGGMWFTSLNNGVFYTSNNDVLLASTDTGVKLKSITGIVEFDGDTYFGFYGGYQKIGSNGWFVESKSSLVKLAHSRNCLVVSSLDYNTVIRNGNIINLTHSRDIEVKNEKIYYGSDRIFCYDIARNKLDTLYDSYTDISGSKQNFFRTLAVSPKNELIVGGRFGILGVKNGKLTNEFGWCRSYDVTDICFTAKFGMVLATSNNGIILSQEGKSRRIVNKKNGLVSNKVHCILELENGLLIIGTNNGLNYMFPNQLRPMLISVNHGVRSSDILSLCATSNYVFVGTEDGVYRLERSMFKFRSQPSDSPIYLQDVEIDGKRVVNFSKRIHLPYQTGRLMVRFRTTNYKKWADKRYQYRLSRQEEWIDITTPEIMIYKPLGEFDVEVRYLDENENWSASTVLLSCSVKVPFWKRWYFVVFVCFLAGLGIFFWLVRRQRNVKRRLQMENEMLSLEQRMQNARMNPHFVFNVLNSIHSFIVFGDKESAEKYLVKFSELMRNTLNETLEGSISIKNELSILDKYLELEQLRSDGSFQYCIESLVENDEVKIPTMILQPIVENAVIHGVTSLEKGGFLSIHLSLTDDKMLTAKIFNNGPISEEQLTKLDNIGLNNAIAITKKRLMNYNLLHQSERYGINAERESSECGVIFTLTIPLI